MNAVLRFSCMVVILAAVVSWALVLPTAAEDPIAESLNLTRSSGSLPIWEKPDTKALTDLSEQVRSVNPSVFIIGHPKAGYGTGFVISKTHRLLATNAHVADIRHQAGALLAIGNNSSRAFEIDQVWYHPGVVRERKGGFRFRSQDPAKGEVSACSPDLAVLHVAGSDGLPEPLALATPSEVSDAFARPVGMLGFPGHDTVSWPGVGENATATYRQGVIARATDFYNNASADPRDRQYLQHTMANWFGFSGSPIFLSNGHVAAVNNSGKTVKRGEMATTLAFGIRIDCLWELLAYHHLEDKVAVPIPASELRLARYEGEDPRNKEYQEVSDLVARAKILYHSEKFAEAGDLLNQAIQRMPTFSEAHHWKAVNHHQYAVVYGKMLSGEAKIDQLKMAFDHRKKALLLEPTNLAYVSGTAWTKMTLDNVISVASTGRVHDFPDIRDLAQRMLDLDELSPKRRGSAYQLYSGSFGLARERIPYLTKAIEIEPYAWDLFSVRADSYRVIGEYSLESADQSRAEQLKRAQTSYLKAWRLSTSPDSGIRDGAQAVQLAKEACQITDNKHWEYVDGLAAAYAESGDFDEAVRWSTRAMELAPEQEKSDLAARLRGYRNRRPWCE